MASHGHHPVVGKLLAQDGERVAELVRPARRSGVVEGHGQIGLGAGSQSRVDDIPRLEAVRERDERVIGTEGRAREGRRGMSCRDARNDVHGDVAQTCVGVLARLEHR